MSPSNYDVKKTSSNGVPSLLFPFHGNFFKHNLMWIQIQYCNIWPSKIIVICWDISNVWLESSASWSLLNNVIKYLLTINCSWVEFRLAHKSRGGFAKVHSHPHKCKLTIWFFILYIFQKCLYNLVLLNVWLQLNIYEL